MKRAEGLSMLAMARSRRVQNEFAKLRSPAIGKGPGKISFKRYLDFLTCTSHFGRRRRRPLPDSCFRL